MKEQLNVTVLQIGELNKQISEDLLGMNCAKYNSNSFLTKTVELTRDNKLSPTEVFIDKRLYYGDDWLSQYETDCKILIECLEKFALYAEMCEGFDQLFDINNGFKIANDNIVVIRPNDEEE